MLYITISLEIIIYTLFVLGLFYATMKFNRDTRIIVSYNTIYSIVYFVLELIFLAMGDIFIQVALVFMVWQAADIINAKFWGEQKIIYPVKALIFFGTISMAAIIFLQLGGIHLFIMYIFTFLSFFGGFQVYVGYIQYSGGSGSGGQVTTVYVSKETREWMKYGGECWAIGGLCLISTTIIISNIFGTGEPLFIILALIATSLVSVICGYFLVESIRNKKDKSEESSIPESDRLFGEYLLEKNESKKKERLLELVKGVDKEKLKQYINLSKDITKIKVFLIKYGASIGEQKTHDSTPMFIGPLTAAIPLLLLFITSMLGILTIEFFIILLLASIVSSTILVIMGWMIKRES